MPGIFFDWTACAKFASMLLRFGMASTPSASVVQLARCDSVRPTVPWEGDMDVREMFLDQHAAVHSAAVGGNKMSAAERAFAGLTDEQMRVRPREDLNSLAWLMWHIARAEDIIVNTVLAGRA